MADKQKVYRVVKTGELLVRKPKAPAFQPRFDRKKSRYAAGDSKKTT